ncbi:hypothetical protein BN1007_90002 [Klebsiella variicola]|nr:hypothetical protein BN1007_90002 [Klebsiella variicola]
MHRNAAHILAVIVGQRDGFTVLTVLRAHFFLPDFIFFVISKSRKAFSRCLTTFPVNAHRHTRRPAGGHAEAAAASASLKRTYNVDARLAIDTEVVNCPFCVVDGVSGATAASGLCGWLCTAG